MPAKSEKSDAPAYKVVPDNKIIHVWKCAECGQTAEVPPTFYADSAIPVCQSEGKCDGDDMEYVETRLLD